MHELLLQIFRYVRGVWRHRWIALAVAWAVAVGGWIYVAQIPDEYRASARVFVDTNSVLRPLLRGLTVQPDLVERVSLMSKMVLNRPNLEKIVRMSDLDLDINTERAKDALLNDLERRIRIGGDRANPSLYNISYEDRDPERAKRVVESLVSIFIEEALVSDQMASTTAQDFLDQEISDYEMRLENAEKLLADFKRNNTGVLPGEDSGYYSSLEGAKTGLRDAELALQEAVRRRKQLAEQLSEISGVSDPDTALSSEWSDPRIVAMQQKLDDLLLRFTDRHPDVMQLRRSIAELKERERSARSAGVTSSAGANMGSDTVYGSIRVAFNGAEAEVAALQARVDDYRERVQALEEKIDTIPQIEAELKQLMRNYETIARQHAELLERRESARLSEEVEKTSEGVKFRVVDPPFAPLRPSAPNRILLAAAVLVLALGAGIGMALVLDLIRPVYDDRRLLYAGTGLPVLGSVGLVQSYAERRNERLMLIPFVLAAGGLLVGFLFVAEGIPILQQWI
ncbi:polysaccharide chain length determinant protein, PEP-CTERM locus subfamily [Thiorhodococcus drewsii AZ1]|uniref:Polysaccharide chain length determinant protein, PEP-CTERM locus subfamily n=1 Tax=Thiorhodococcus drewsii AZ1 TaxID=765913 RepID=G2E615_9GAMM|nr:XrtA system polysaccharide chain length determinant [Thiorhodococcus drewsii]EGV28500.1 polysaccharide chain length determinant protein, PEP-CTERM locus subfamily [Thiorhodococcus drewsii AZ1]